MSDRGFGTADLPFAAFAALLGVAVHRRALAAFFSTDDLILLERAAGLAQFPPTLWRVISGQLYFRLGFPLLGTHAMPWHAIVLLLHAGTAVALYAWVRSVGGGRWLAGGAAALWSTSRLHFTVTHQVIGAGEELATFFALATLVLLARGGRATRLSAIPFALGLLCKESIALVPLVSLLGHAQTDGRGMRERCRELAPLLLVAIALGAYLLLQRHALGSLGGEAYRAGLGTHVPLNVLQYLAWGGDLLGINRFVNPFPVVGAVLWGGLTALILGVGSLRAWSRTRLPAMGLALWFVALVPVLPLVHQLNAHYLYLPFAGMALTIAALLADAYAQRSRSRARRPAIPQTRFAMGILAVLLLAHAGLADATLQARSLELPGPTRISGDPLYGKMQYAQRITTSLDAVLGPDAARVVLLTPPGSELLVSARTGQVAQADRATPQYDFAQGVLDNGLALRLLLPRIQDVRFDHHYRSEYENWTLTMLSGDGVVLPAGRGPASAEPVSQAWAAAGYPEQARDYVGEVLATVPDALPLVLVHATARARAGDTAGGMAELDSLVHAWPKTPEAATAANILERARAKIAEGAERGR